MAHILSIGTAVPPHILPQSDVVPILTDALGHAPPPRLASILTNTGIAQRHIAEDIGYYFRPRRASERAATFERVATALWEQAAQDALDRAGLAPAEIGTIVTVCTTGTLTPSIPSRALQRMGFAPTTRTVPVFGWGCAGGGLGLSLAATLADAGRGEGALLLVCVELCSLAYDHSSMEKKDLVALALFSDGCAAAVIAPGDGPNRLGPFAQHCWPDTIPMMGWEIGDTGFDLVLSRDIPRFVEKDFAPFCDAFLASQSLSRADLAEPACHPGGGRVVEALAAMFGRDLPATAAVLRDYGNMSSPTVLFILDRLLSRRARGGEPVLVTALGPGFTGTAALVHL
ncbi:type III polyketide synthase [Croceicoccus sp. YJ47]|uniref:type III polyketide synthase n=1 Tax=Croceicoccus sp. YJ47 TaxID=2798724 RepID=UPI001920CD26|nr:3-oxoacyl-[acyl-carrier-protein] synthase III C-terminal domain-containing protein [Croceicoccus sp. YJ47]QQN73481.1 type III polyketide synthase [Croceicoccus sp. YJ47]